MATVGSPQTAFDFAGFGALKAQAAKDPKNAEAAKKAAQQFEAMFLQMMLKSMRDAVPKSELFESNAMDTYTQMFDQQVVMAMSERGSTGIAQMIEGFILKNQGDSLDPGAEKFLLTPEKQSGLPLVNESDAFQIPKASAQEFLLQRNRFLLDQGGDS